jgi:hypothetical protein
MIEEAAAQNSDSAGQWTEIARVTFGWERSTDLLRVSAGTARPKKALNAAGEILTERPGDMAR